MIIEGGANFTLAEAITYRTIVTPHVQGHSADQRQILG